MSKDNFSRDENLNDYEEIVQDEPSAASDNNEVNGSNLTFQGNVFINSAQITLPDSNDSNVPNIYLAPNSSVTFGLNAQVNGSDISGQQFVNLLPVTITFTDIFEEVLPTENEEMNVTGNSDDSCKE